MNRELKELYPKDEYGYKEYLEYFKNELETLDEKTNEQIYQLYNEYYDDVTRYINGNFYVQVDDFHDCFRKYGYPEDNLFSLEETIKYMYDEKNNCTTYENSIKWVTEFWNKYPDGIICFG